MLHKHANLKSCRLADGPAYLSIIAFIISGVIGTFLFIGALQRFAASKKFLHIGLSKGLSRRVGVEMNVTILALTQLPRDWHMSENPDTLWTYKLAPMEP